MSDTTALGRLIETAARNNHRSMQQAADLATSRGAPISKSTISDAARCVETVTPKVILGIAAGYDIPAEEVARAMLSDLGFEISDYSPDAETAIRRDPDLSSEARAMLLAAIGAARKSADFAVAPTDEPKNLPRRTLIGRRKPGKEPGVGRDQQSS